jgi:hypothetical protein
MKSRVLFLTVLVLSILIVSSVGTAFAGEPNGRAWGNAVEGEPGVWRAHFALLGVEDADGADWGKAVSDFAKANGGMGGHSSGK